jgi:hypothetical protein
MIVFRTDVYIYNEDILVWNLKSFIIRLVSGLPWKDNKIVSIVFRFTLIVLNERYFEQMF